MRVRLAVYSSFAVKWLIPRLAGLRQLYPELDLSLEMVAEDPELSDRVADGFITVSPEGPGYMHDLLYRERLMPVCSRRMWQQVEGEGRHPVAVAAALHPGYLPREGEDWRRWAEMGGLTIPPRRGCTISAIFCSRWRRRTGIREWRSSTTICCSRRIRVWCGCPCTPETGDNFYFVFKRSRAHEPAISRLRQWLWQESQASLRPGKTSLSGASERPGPHAEWMAAHDAGV
jgi:DNA-binding transcriptional LysR family regulator